MQDLFLKFPDKATAVSVLYNTENDTNVNEVNGDEVSKDVLVPKYINIDMIGTLYNNDAVLDDDGNVVKASTIIPGWHANVRVMPEEDASQLVPFVVVPTQPRRVWA